MFGNQPTSLPRLGMSSRPNGTKKSDWNVLPPAKNGRAELKQFRQRPPAKTQPCTAFHEPVTLAQWEAWLVRQESISGRPDRGLCTSRAQFPLRFVAKKSLLAVQALFILWT